MDLSMWLGLLVASLGALYLLFRYLTRNLDCWEKQGVKTIPQKLLFGSMGEYFKKYSFEVESERIKKYGRIYGGYEVHCPVLYVAEPDLVRQILVKDFHIFTNRREINTSISVLDSAVSIARNEKWKRIRTVVSPSFTSGKMRKMQPLFTGCLKNLKRNFIKAADSNEVVDLKRYFTAFTMDIIGLCAFGIDINFMSNPDHPFGVNARKLFNQEPTLMNKLFFAILFVPGSLKLFGRFFFSRLGFQYFIDVCREIVQKRKDTPPQNRPVDLLQLMLDAREGKIDKDEDSQQSTPYFQEEGTNHQKAWNITKTISEDEILSQSFIFFLAGHETSSTALSFIGYELAMNPDIQERLHEEVVDTYKAHGEFNYDVVNKMPYLEAVISETLRLHTIAFRVERQASQDYELGSTGITLPKGSVVAINAYALHHDSEWFPDPEKFYPDRFLPDNRSSIHPYSYLPFGDGPRNCVGMRFAVLELKLCLATLVKDIKFVATEETRKPLDYYKNAQILQPKAVKLRVEKRSLST